MILSSHRLDVSRLSCVVCPKINEMAGVCHSEVVDSPLELRVNLDFHSVERSCCVRILERGWGTVAINYVTSVP